MHEGPMRFTRRRTPCYEANMRIDFDPAALSALSASLRSLNKVPSQLTLAEKTQVAEDNHISLPQLEAFISAFDWNPAPDARPRLEGPMALGAVVASPQAPDASLFGGSPGAILSGA